MFKLLFISDLVSFYTLPSTIMHHPTYRTLKAAYSFYNVSTKTPWVDLMQDALISARDVIYKLLIYINIFFNNIFLKYSKLFLYIYNINKYYIKII